MLLGLMSPILQNVLIEFCQQPRLGPLHKVVNRLVVTRFAHVEIINNGQWTFSDGLRHDELS